MSAPNGPAVPAEETGYPAVQPVSPEARRPFPWRRRLAMLLAALSVLAIVLAVAAPPHAVLDKADLLGYALCHQIPERSFFLQGRQLPFCARCTGTFLGAMLGLGVMLLWRRGRSSHLPPPIVLGALVLFMGLWAADGLNSYLTFFPGAPHLYEPRNWLRLSTGVLNGLALITFILPIWNFAIWRNPVREPVIRNIWEIAAILPVAALLILAVLAQIDFLLYPLALVSSLGAMILLTVINSMIAAIVLGREGYARTWRQAVVPLISGAGLAVLQIAALDLLRTYLTSTFGIAF